MASGFRVECLGIIQGLYSSHSLLIASKLEGLGFRVLGEIALDPLKGS